MVAKLFLFLTPVVVAAASPMAAFPILGTMPLLWLLALAAFVYYSYIPRHRFKKGGIKYLTPVPLLGDMARVIFRWQNVFLNIDRVYAAFPGERFVGMSECVRPAVVIRDIELVKRIAGKDFDHFTDHSLIIDKDVDRMFGRSVFIMKGEEWRAMRHTLSPVFTNSKLKRMVPAMVAVGNRMVADIKRRVHEGKTNYWDYNFNILALKYNFEIIVSCAFGLDIDGKGNSNEDLFQMGKMLSEMKYSQLICFLGFQIFPNFMKVIRATMFPKASGDFFKKLLIRTMKAREGSTDERHDFVDIIIKAQSALRENYKESVPDASAPVEDSEKNRKRLWSDDDILAQALLLLIAGFDPISAAIGLMIHELVLNPDIQERLVQEILETDKKSGGQIDYASILEMTYLDMVILETLRKWANSNIDRVCTKDYNLGRPNDSATEDYIIRKGEGLYVPMRSFHFDPQYFPDPDKFDPERFSKENIHKIPQFAYKPFGLGLRMCMGNRFTIYVMKVLLYQLLRDVTLTRCPKTTSTISLDPTTISMRNREGSWVRMALRR